MRTAVFSSFNFAPSFVGPVFNMLQSSIDEGDEVYFITCLKSFKSCGFNTFKLKYMCDLCSYRFRMATEQVEGNYHLVKLSDLFIEDDRRETTEFVSGVSSITKQTYYGTFDVGESVLSSYISKTRDKDMELPVNEEVLPELTTQTVMVYKAVKRFLKEKSIEKVLLFNGRWDYYRAVFRAANELGIACMIFENFRSGGIIELYGNAFPHIISNKQQKYDASWADSVAISEKKEVAREYFSRKRNGEVVIGRSFTKEQTRSLLPPEVDRNKRVLVLFNSSDDEFAAVAGDEYKNPYFENQMEGILYVAELVATKLPDYQLVIRMHPNLSGVGFQYLRPIYDLKNKFPNVFLIEPGNKVDSYALLEIAYKVITFGSSIGVEANYWRKPVILLARPSYFYSDLAHRPNDKNEILELLRNDLPLKPVENSEKIAYYMMRGGVKAPYYNYVFRKQYFFKNYRIDKLPFIHKNYFRLLKFLQLKN